MMVTQTHRRGLLTFALCVLIFEFVAFADFDGAQADDRRLFEVGGAFTGVTAAPPPNLLFLFDTSGSMNNLMCEDFSSESDCDNRNDLVAKNAPNSATICAHPVLDAVLGPDRTGDGVRDTYAGPYDPADGTTWISIQYAIFDDRGSDPDHYPPWSTYSHSKHSRYNQRELGTGATDQERIDDVINDECNRYSGQPEARCKYSLRTQGYFWEPSGSNCGSGNPLAATVGEIGPGIFCPIPSLPASSRDRGPGDPCSNDNQCQAEPECHGGTGRCGACDYNSDCDSGSCGDHGCGYATCNAYCAGGGACGSITIAAGGPGWSCTNNNDCDGTDSGHGFECHNNRCSFCNSNGDCPGNTRCRNYGCGFSTCGAIKCATAAPMTFGSPCNGDEDCDGRIECEGNRHCAECDTNSDCPGGETCGSYGCGYKTCSGTVCTGISFPAGGPGSTCAADSDCNANLVCDSGNRCSYCNTGGQCSGSCVYDATCGYSICDTASCSGRIPPGGLGAGCGTDSDCNGLLECWRPASGGGTCGECGDDADCAGGETCGMHGCPYPTCSGDPCNVDMLPPGSLGDTCSSDNDCNGNRDGTGGLQCFTDTGVEPASGVCSTCASDADCAGSDTCGFHGCGYATCSSTICGDVDFGPGPVAGGGSSGTAGTGLVLMGDYFNFYPPKGPALVKAFKDTVYGLTSDARVGISDFGDVGSGTVAHPIDPSCDDAAATRCFDGTVSSKCFDPNYDDNDSNTTPEMIEYLHDHGGNGLRFGGSTPVARHLDNAGAYYATTGSSAPICDYSASLTRCGMGSNYVIQITDGMPSSDAWSAWQLPHSNNNITGFSDAYAYDNNEYVDDVAKALANIDHRSDITEEQLVTTFAISFGMVDPTDPTKCIGLLEQVGQAGGGSCLPATDVHALEDALVTLVQMVLDRSQGFTAPSLPATRLSAQESLSTAAFFPKLTYSLWEGHVYGFTICDETLSGATCTCEGSATICIEDATGDPIVYDADGYLSLGSEAIWDAAICLSKDMADPPPDGDPPDRNDLDTTACYKSATTRTIYTAVDHDGDGDLDQIDFTKANIDTYSVFRDAVKTGDTPGAKKIVSFYRGFDSFDADTDGNVTEDRNLKTIRDSSGDLLDGWWKLGDIFHSVPNVIERPIGRGLGAWSNTESYQAFATTWTDRDRVMLVGANDGMLHAFHTGTWDANLERYDSGTGTELWAYVTPEMLPKLGTTCDPGSGGCSLSSHVWMVDGSVMVRDIWIGGTADKTDAANKTLWKTVAVVGHRRGGRTYVAFDITDINSPQLIWQFPEPGSAQDALVGQSWLDVFPAPASIGPLKVKNAGNTTYDKWVVLLSGGFDPTGSRGNALFVLDAWTGGVLWQATDSNAGDDTDEMHYSFPATPVFYANTGGGFPYIGGIVAADHGGQIWHITPADVVLDDTSPSFNIEITFRSVATLVDPDGNGGNSDGVVDFSEYQPRPFFFAPALTRYAGVVRVIIGTGDRDMLIPHGAVPPADGSYGSECTVDGDCTDSGAECVAGRCSECDTDADCSGPATCRTTDCGYSFCSTSSCDVPVGGNDVSLAINDAICTYEQRLYALNLERCSDGSGGTEPCTEAHASIIKINDSTSTYASTTHQGWYYILDEGIGGEKVAAPYDIFAGYALYSTFAPTVACGGSVEVCSVQTKGVARLHARHFLTGEPLDWDNSGAYEAGEEYVYLGEGVPTAPSISAAVGEDGVTPTIFAGGSDSSLTSRTLGAIEQELVMEILRFPVSKDIHARLHE